MVTLTSCISPAFIFWSSRSTSGEACRIRTKSEVKGLVELNGGGDDDHDGDGGGIMPIGV